MLDLVPLFSLDLFSLVILDLLPFNLGISLAIKFGPTLT